MKVDTGKEILPGKGLDIKGRTLARNAIFNLIGLGLPLILAVITIPVIIRFIGKERFGILSLAWAVFGYLSVFDVGLVQATTKHVAEALGRGERHNVPKYLWTTVIFQSLLGSIGALLLILVTPALVEQVFNIPEPLHGEARTVFILIALSLPISLITGSFRGTLEASQRFDLVNVIRVPSAAASNLLPLGGALLGFSLPLIVLLIIFSRLITLFGWAIMSFRIYAELHGRIAFHKEVARPLLSFGGWITVSSLLNPILLYLDRFMIGALLTLTAVSYYSAPYEITVRLGVLPGSLLMLLFPAFSALHGSRDMDKARSLFGRSLKYLLAGLGPFIILVIIFAPQILGVWLGKDFARHSAGVLQILSAGFLLNVLANVAVGFVLGQGRSDIPAKFHMLEVVIYIPLLWGLIRLLGIRGAALAWTIRVSLDMVLLFSSARRIGGKSFPRPVDYRIVSLALVLLAFAAGVYTAKGILNDIIIMILTVIFLLVALGLAYWIMVFQDYEKEKLGAIAKKMVFHCKHPPWRKNE